MSKALDWFWEQPLQRSRLDYKSLVSRVIKAGHLSIQTLGEAGGNRILHSGLKKCPVTSGTVWVLSSDIGYHQ